jgi:hypothetical protein
MSEPSKVNIVPGTKIININPENNTFEYADEEDFEEWEEVPEESSPSATENEFMSDEEQKEFEAKCKADAEKMIELNIFMHVAEDYFDLLEDNDRLIKLNEYLLEQQETNLKLCDRYRDLLNTSYRNYETTVKDMGVIMIFVLIAWLISVLILICK